MRPVSSAAMGKRGMGGVEGVEGEVVGLVVPRYQEHGECQHIQWHR